MANRNWKLEIGKWKINQRGYTLVELIMVMVIFSILAALVTINLVQSKQTASLNTTVSVFVSDLKLQQLKAMIGDGEGRSTSDSYGVHLDASEYILFHGIYSASESSNTTIPLGDNITPATPGAEIIFTKVSGDTTATSLILRDNVTNEQRTIQINRYGVVTGVN